MHRKAVVLLALAAGVGAASPAPASMRYSSTRVEGDYDLSVRIQFDAADGAARIALHHEGDREILVEAGRGRLRILKREGARETGLAEGTLPADTGLREIRIMRRGVRIAAAVPGGAAVVADASGIDGGTIGFQAVSPGARLVNVTPPRHPEPLLREDDFTRGIAEASEWRIEAGGFGLRRPAVSGAVNAQFHFAGVPKPGEPRAVATIGPYSADAYAVEAAVRLPDPASAAGVVAGWLPGGRGIAARLGRRLEIVALDGSGERVLSGREVEAPRSGQWYRLSLAIGWGRAVAFLDDGSPVEAEEPSLLAGAPGLAAWGSQGALFDDFAAQAGAPDPAKGADAVLAFLRARRRSRREMDRIAEILKRDPEMRVWSGPGALWRTERDGTGFGYRIEHRGALFGPARVLLPAPASEGASAEVRLAPASGAGKPLRIRLARRGGELVLDAGAEGGEPARANAKGGGETAAISWGGGKVRLLQGGAETAAVPAEAPGSYRMSLAFSGLAPAPEGIGLESDAVFDDVFARAPADWWTASGRWETTSRWACLPELNFFAAESEGLALAATKTAFGEDVSVHVFLAPTMVHRRSPGYPFPMNAGIAAGVQGLDPGSGYTLLWGGLDIPTRLLRREQVLASTDALIVPGFRADWSEVLARIHKGWFDLALEKTGGEIKVLLEGRPLLAARDPEPLPGGRVALWTAGTGISFARVRIQGERRDAPAPGRPKAPDALGRPLALDPFDASQRPSLVLDGEFPGALSLALRGECRGVAFAVAVRGALPPGPWAGVGEAPGGTAPWEGSRAIPLGARLRRLFPEGPLPIRDLAIRPVDPDPLVRAGVTANRAEASWRLRSARAEGDPLPASAPALRRILVGGIDATGDLSDRASLTGIRNAAGADGVWVVPQLEGVPSPFDRILPRRVGASSAAEILRGPLDPRRFPALLLRHRVDPGFRADLAIEAGSREWAIAFHDNTGLSDESGEIMDVRAVGAARASEGRFGTALVDLSGPARAIGARVIDRVLMRDSARKNNAPGAGALEVLEASRVLAIGAGEDPEIRVEGAAGEIEAVLVPGFGAEPPQGFRARGAAPRLKDAAEGREFSEGDFSLFVRPAGSGGARRVPIRIERRPAQDPPDLRVETVSPADGERSAHMTVVARLSPAPAVDPHRVVLEVGARAFRPGDAGVRFEAQAGILRFDAAEAAVGIAEGDVRCRIRAGGLAIGSAVEKAWTWTRDPALDKEAPPAPRVAYRPGNAVTFLDFEDDAGAYGNAFRAECRIAEGEAAAGRRSLRIGSILHPGRTSRFFLHEGALPADASLRVAFDARVPAGTELRFFRGRIEGEDFREVLQGVPGDGRWHRFEGSLLAGERGGPPEPFGIAFHRIRETDVFAVDNVAIWPEGDTDPGFVWSVQADETGVAGYSWALDDRPDTIPDDRAESPEPRASFPGADKARRWFHVRAVDGAGNWGPAAHLEAKR